METIPTIRPTKLRRPKKPTHCVIPKKIKCETKFTPKPCKQGHTVCSCH